MYNWITLLYTETEEMIITQLYSNVKFWKESYRNQKELFFVCVGFWYDAGEGRGGVEHLDIIWGCIFQCFGVLRLLVSLLIFLLRI